MIGEHSGCSGVVRTLHWHQRSVAEAAQRYRAAVWAKRPPSGDALQPLGHALEDGQELWDGVQAFTVERADEVALWLPAQSALVFADAMLRRESGELRVCPDSWTQPEGGPAGLRAVLDGLTRLPAEHVLVRTARSSWATASSRSGPRLPRPDRQNGSLGSEGTAGARSTAVPRGGAGARRLQRWDERVGHHALVAQGERGHGLTADESNEGLALERGCVIERREPANEPRLVGTEEPQLDRGGAPPALDSGEYADDFNQTKSLGELGSTTQTADQTPIAKFWGAAPAWVVWNQVADQAGVAFGNNVGQNARLFVALDTTLADSAIAVYDAKYTYHRWRPITAITAADQGNPNAVADSSRVPFANTANDPGYPGAHAEFSAPASTVLRDFFGTDTFSFALSNPTVNITRTFTSFSGASNEANASRIFAGQHFQYDENAGQTQGSQVADFVLDHAFEHSGDRGHHHHDDRGAGRTHGGQLESDLGQAATLRA